MPNSVLAFTATLAYNPFAPLILTRSVDILPHQLAALYGDIAREHECTSPLPHRLGGLLRSGFPIRAIVADETGLGKTVIMGLAILSFTLRNLARNILIVAPKAVVGQWQDELFYKFSLYFKVVEQGDEFKDLGEEVSAGKNFMVITSIDLIKVGKGSEFVSSLKNWSIDLTVIDEAHHVITPSETRRAEIAWELAKKSKSLVLLSATPFRGYNDVEYRRVLGLLGDSFIYIRRFKDNVVDIHGKPIFPKRMSYVVEVGLDASTLNKVLQIRQLLSSAPIPNLTRLLLFKREASSWHALRDSLQNLTIKSSEDPFSEETDDVVGLEPDAVKPVDIPHYKRLGHILRSVLDIVETLVSSHKLSPKEAEFLELLQTLIKRGKVVVFTEYLSTLERLKQILSSYDIKFVYIHGGMSLRERRSAIEKFWRDDRIRVFLGTDAAGEGINLQVARYQINYDIPWSPLKLEQRFGRVHRYGQKQVAVLYNVAVKPGIDEVVVEKLLRKLEGVARLLGDWIYDYIGTAVRPEEVRRIILQGEDIVDEKVITERLARIRKDLHSPKVDLDSVMSGVKRVENFIEAEFGKRPGLLEIWRSAELLSVYSNRCKREPPSLEVNVKVRDNDVVLGIYRNGGHVMVAYTLVRRGELYYDPLDAVYVPGDNVIKYLHDKVKGLAQFYGFSEGDFVLCINFS